MKKRSTSRKWRRNHTGHRIAGCENLPGRLHSAVNGGGGGTSDPGRVTRLGFWGGSGEVCCSLSPNLLRFLDQDQVTLGLVGTMSLLSAMSGKKKFGLELWKFGRMGFERWGFLCFEMESNTPFQNFTATLFSSLFSVASFYRQYDAWLPTVHTTPNTILLNYSNFKLQPILSASSILLIV